jgi:hypothetical protein
MSGNKGEKFIEKGNVTLDKSVDNSADHPKGAMVKETINQQTTVQTTQMIAPGPALGMPATLPIFGGMNQPQNFMSSLQKGNLPSESGSSMQSQKGQTVLMVPGLGGYSITLGPGLQHIAIGAQWRQTAYGMFLDSPAGMFRLGQDGLLHQQYPPIGQEISGIGANSRTGVVGQQLQQSLAFSAGAAAAKNVSYTGLVHRDTGQLHHRVVR